MMTKGEEVFFIRPVAVEVEEGLYKPEPIMLKGTVTGHKATIVGSGVLCHLVRVGNQVHTLTEGLRQPSEALPEALVKCLWCGGWGRFITDMKWFRDALIRGETPVEPQFKTYEPVDCVSCQGAGFIELGKNGHEDRWPESEEEWQKLAPVIQRTVKEAVGDGTRGVPFEGMLVRNLEKERTND